MKHAAFLIIWPGKLHLDSDLICNGFSVQNNLRGGDLYFVYSFQIFNLIAAFTPPNPESILITSAVLSLRLAISIQMMVSTTPAAPIVCPNWGLSAEIGIFCNPARSMAMVSIASL